MHVQVEYLQLWALSGRYRKRKLKNPFVLRTQPSVSAVVWWKRAIGRSGCRAWERSKSRLSSGRLRNGSTGKDRCKKKRQKNKSVGKHGEHSTYSHRRIWASTNLEYFKTTNKTLHAASTPSIYQRRLERSLHEVKPADNPAGLENEGQRCLWLA
jgi:hypothetical protein